MPLTIQPTHADITIARAIARNTGWPVEQAARWITWGADEHILCGAAAAWWLFCRGASGEQRRASDHVLLTTIAATLLPHLLKTVFNQERPDRLTIQGHLNGVPLSGKACDAFPSGHAIHIGALTSAADQLQPMSRNIVGAFGAGLVLTRVVLLAHWASDVVAGIGLGVLLERMLRPLTGFGRRRTAVG